MHYHFFLKQMEYGNLNLPPQGKEYMSMRLEYMPLPFDLYSTKHLEKKNYMNHQFEWTFWIVGLLSRDSLSLISTAAQNCCLRLLVWIINTLKTIIVAWKIRRLLHQGEFAKVIGICLDWDSRNSVMHKISSNVSELPKRKDTKNYPWCENYKDGHHRKFKCLKWTTSSDDNFLYDQ